MSRSSPLLQIKHLRRLMVGPVSFDVAAGECLCVSGSSGVGKSLLLRAIADLDPHEGEVWLDGLACQATDPSTWRHRVGLLPPESSWWLPCARDHFPEDQSWSLEALGLDDRLFGEPVARLSSGERQRFALLRLLANDPQVLLLDEPTANLDPLSAQRVEAVIADYRKTRQAAVIWVSHDPAQIQRVADRQLRFEGGTLREVDAGRGS